MYSNIIYLSASGVGKFHAYMHNVVLHIINFLIW